MKPLSYLAADELQDYQNITKISLVSSLERVKGNIRTQKCLLQMLSISGILYIIEKKTAREFVESLMALCISNCT